MDIHTDMMYRAIIQAQEARESGEIPVGAIIYCIKNHQAEILAETHNQTIANQNPTAHAELLACEEATKKRKSPYLEDCYLAVTLEPCAMCAQALSYYRIKEIRFGAYDPKSGGTTNNARVLDYAHHKPTVYGGMLEEDCSALLTNFFRKKRHVAEK